MNIWIILLVLIILIAGGILMFKAAAPAVVEFHRDSLAPIRSIAGNPSSGTALAAMI